MMLNVCKLLLPVDLLVWDVVGNKVICGEDEALPGTVGSVAFVDDGRPCPIFLSGIFSSDMFSF
jgi:hypothetical protein